MRTRAPSFFKSQHALLVSLTLAAVATIGFSASASANSSYRTTILNVVTVNYKDAGGTNNYAANASTIVTVNLVKAALNPSGAPTVGNGNPALTCLGAVNVSSGSTISALYALTAAANGDDTYNFSMGAPTLNNVTGSVTYSLLDYTGANPTSPATRLLGSAIPTRAIDASTLEFPGGALAGFAVNDIVIVRRAAGANGLRAFLVTAVDAGKAPVFTHTGGNTYTDATGAFSQAELKGTMALGAYANQTITLNSSNDTTFGGGGAAPAFTIGTGDIAIGLPVGEMVLVKVSVTASTNSGTDGTVDYVLTTTDSTPGNPATIGCNVATFKAPNLSIKKEARNVTTSGSFAATAVGNPGQILEYQVTVSNSGGQASKVVVADAVPSYTTLVTFTGTYSTGGAGTGAATNKFARITDNATNTLDLDVQNNAVTEVQPLTPRVTGYGTAAGITATSALTFNVGDTATNVATFGGKLPYCSDGSAVSFTGTCSTGTAITTLTILYQVKID